MTEMEFSYLKRKIRQLLGIDIDAYKSQQMRRRLEGFVARQGGGNAFRFCRAIEKDRTLLQELERVLTINVSEFYRDPQEFQRLKEVVLQDLLQSSRRLNVWTAGCSQGQEPYSIALILRELSPSRRHRILATDVDGEALQRAQAGGPYRPEELRHVPRWQLQRYFRPAGDGFLLGEEIRGLVEFRRHNLLSDDFEEGFDLILCRNVMIYFSPAMKERLFRRFHRSLRPGGILFLGGTEAMLNASALGFQRLFGSFYRRWESGAALAGTAASGAERRE